MRSLQKELIDVETDGVSLEGMLTIPAGATGIILFAHGSGSSRLSPRNNYVAEYLRQFRMGTLLIDLLTPHEDSNLSMRFDISLLSRRLNAACDWLQASETTAHLPIGLFGASTGAAAALQVAAMRGEGIVAVVSRGGRPDLAGHSALRMVNTPTLLIIGGHDDIVIELNRQAYALLRCEKRLEIIPGATHLFEETGALEQVAALAAEWFVRHLIGPEAIATKS